MSTTVQNILAQIDRLDETGQAELRAELRLRARAAWEKLAEEERRCSTEEGVSEEDIQRAVEEVRYGGNAS